jgi:hypothetical protein
MVDTATGRWRRHGAFSERELGGCDLCEGESKGVSQQILTANQVRP